MFAGAILCRLLIAAARAGTLVEFVAPVGNYGTDPYYPMAGLTEGLDGAFYGTSSQGGSNNNQGTVFRVTVQGLRTTIVSFNKTNGASPEARLLRASDGNLYGTTFDGGVEKGGTVFRISTNGVFTNLASFTVSGVGVAPHGALIEGLDGKLYGTTSYGGPNNGLGTIFRLEADGRMTTILSFQVPGGGLVLGSDGAFYGTTGGGGTSGKGTVFRATTNGALTTLCSFNGTNGASPNGELVRGDDSSFYGTTLLGGADTNQSPYGTGFGTVFRVTPLGELTSLASFYKTNGANPRAGLAKGTDGNLYGTTSAGGNLDTGTLFQLTSAGVLHSLHTMRADIEGSFVLAGLTQGTDGRFYGTSAAGGQIGAGAIFRMSVPLAVGQTLTVTNGSVTIGWKTVVGRSYQVQWSSELTANWSNLGPAISATGGYTNITEPLSSGTLKRYYRVMTMP